MTDQPLQRPHEQALQRGLERLRSQVPSPERLQSLGATMAADTIRLPALNRCLYIDLAQRQVRVDDTEPARSAWAVLAVHYLCAEDLAPDPHEVSFSHFQDCRSYLSVFDRRITARFLATSGRTAQEFVRLGTQLGGTKVPGSGTGFRFNVLPRVPITFVRYEGDDEIPAGASVLYRADAERLLPAEDRVVAAELLLDVLSGKAMTDTGGSHDRRK
jgi:hypothetical protein